MRFQSQFPSFRSLSLFGISLVRFCSSSVLSVSLWFILGFTAGSACAADWVEIGVDTEATYYVDVSSIEVEGDTVRVLKKGIFPQPLKEELGGAQKIFTQTLGIVELDCGRRINRVVQIDMLGSGGDVVWSSGRMSRRMWEDVRPHTHGEATLDFVCGKLGRQ